MTETREEINLRFDLLELDLYRQYHEDLTDAFLQFSPRADALITARDEALAALDSPFILYDQTDPRWGTDRLGFGSTSIARYGCVITALAMAATEVSGGKWTPDEVNDALKFVGGYVGVNRNLVVWRKVDDALPLKFAWMAYSTWTPAPIKRIDAALEAGLYVLAQVDRNPATVGVDEHWVLLRKKPQWGYIFADPLGGVERVIPPTYCRDDWDTARAIFKVVVYGPK